METQKIMFFLRNTYLCVSAVMFCKKKIAYAVHIDCCYHSINIQAGLNMHLYDDIGDASSSLRVSTSSYINSFF